MSADREMPSPPYDDRSLIDAMVAAIKDRYPGYIVAWCQAFGWSIERGTKIPNTAEQHGPTDVAEIAGFGEVVADFHYFAVFESADR